MGDVLEVSPFDDCTYDQFVLPNGLEVVLVHDVESEQSGACMCVKAGALLGIVCPFLSFSLQF